VEERTASSTGLAPRALPPLPPLSVRCPLLLPALAAAAGAWTAARLTSAPVELLVVLVAAGVALRGRTGLTVAWLAAGLLWAQVRWVTPQQALLAVDRSRPVEIAGDVSGCWSADEEGASVTLALRRIAQGERVLRAAGRVRLHLPREPALPSCGGRLAARGYLRPPHVYRNVVEITVGGWSMWVKSPALLRLEGPPGPLARVATLVRRRLFPPRFLPEERPGLRLARALLLGDGGALPQEQREAMRRVGLAHLIAVSGLNVGMVGGLFLVVLLRAPRALRLVGTLAGVGGYALLVGPQPSLLRAVLMAATLTAGLLLRRLPSAANGLAASCLLLLAVDPSWVDDVGFQLSVAATAGLLVLSGPLREHLRALGPPAAPLGVTLAAQLATLPWSLASFGRLSAASPLANLIAVPWAAVALTVALAWATLRLAVGGVAAALLPVLDALAAPLRLLEHLPASPWVSLPFRTGAIAAGAITALLVWCALRPAPRWSAAVRLASAGALVWACAPARTQTSPEIVMLDVGQGDAFLLRDGPASLLVDGGGWRTAGFGGRVLVPALAALGVRRLDALAVTHPDADHCYGAVDLVREIPVGTVWLPPGLEETICGRGLRAGVGARVHEIASGRQLVVGRWQLRALAPGIDVPRKRTESSGTDNRRSLVLRAQSAGRCALLTGDLDAAGERALLARWGTAALRCDLLKVAHHGSPSSSSAALLAAVRPRLAWISVGARNAYGHPSPRVLAALAASGALTARTDRDGMVHLRWGRRWSLSVTAP